MTKEEKRKYDQEYRREWRKSNLEKCKESSRRSWHKNKEKHKKRKKEYYQDHKEEIDIKNKKWKKEHKEELKIWNKAYRLEHIYSLTLEQVNEMLIKQDYKCAICDEMLNGKGDIDHDHETGKVRGILCRTCNLKLAGIENPKFYRKAINYLKGDKEGV